MSSYINYLTRSSPSASISFNFFLHRRLYSSDNKTSINHYDALGVNSNASAKEIKTAFYKLSKKHHPDVNPDDVNAANKFSTISNAYDILGDPTKRRDYDNELLARTFINDPYVTYDRTSTYAQRARAHRPSSWKRPPPSSSRSDGGFPGSEDAFGNSRSTNYGTFDRDQYDAAFGRFRGATPSGRTNIYDFDEFYRAHYGESQNFEAARKQAQERLRHERQQQEEKRQEKANRSTVSKLSTVAIWVSLGLAVIFISNLLHDMHFQQPTNELQAKFYIVSKPSKTKSLQKEASDKS